MQYTINDIRNNIFQEVFNVYTIFQNYFGEEYTDLQEIPTDEDLSSVITVYDGDPSNLYSISLSDHQLQQVKDFYETLKPIILVWWPEVTITNENNKSVKIKDLFAKIEVTVEGKIPLENHGFLLNKATYSSLQFTSGYVHSHVQGFSGTNIPGFQSPCLGRGPIQNTIHSLKMENDEVTWMLFCEELSRYVTVESLKGVPYRKLEQLGSTKRLSGYSQFEHYELSSGFYDHDEAKKQEFYDDLAKFALYYLEHGHLVFNYTDSKFCIGMTPFTFHIDISNCFIDWVNKYKTSEDAQDMARRRMIISTTVKDGTFYEPNTVSSIDREAFSNHHIVWFKGQNIRLKIEDSNEEQQITTLLNNSISLYLLHNIMKIINYHYQNEHTHNNKPTSTPYQTVYYI